MKVIYRKYLKWSSLKDKVVLYTGEGPVGKTLAAVIQLVEEKDKRPIVSNATLNLPNSKKLRMGKLLQYRNKRIFIDTAEIVLNSKRPSTRRGLLFTSFLAVHRKLGHQLTLASPNMNYLDIRVRNSIEVILQPYFYKDKNGVPKLQLKRINLQKQEATIYLPINCRKYFKYFDTKECIRP